MFGYQVHIAVAQGAQAADIAELLSGVAERESNLGAAAAYGKLGNLSIFECLLQVRSIRVLSSQKNLKV